MDRIVFVLFVGLGCSSWLAINGVYAELPLLVDRLPEKWAVNSALTLAIQAGNIGPFAVWASGRRYGPGRVLVPAIAALLAMATLAPLLLAFWWGVAWRGRSMVLIGLTFVAALADCTSTVTFYPYLARFPAVYVGALMLGETLTGLLASVFTWIQTAWFAHSESTALVFGPQTYFLLLASLMVTSAAAFVGLEYSARARAAAALVGMEGSRTRANAGESDEDRAQLLPAGYGVNSAAPVVASLRSAARFLCRDLFFQLLVLGWSSFLQNGALPAISSYAAMPYGTRTYHLGTTLSQSLAPAGAVVALRYRAGARVALCLLGLWTIMAFYTISLALTSPNPPLVASGAGSFLAVTASVVTACSITYSKTLALLQCKEHVSKRCPSLAADVLFLAGVAVQACSLVAALLFFGLVNYTATFQE